MKTFLKVTGGVFVGNIITLAVVAVLLPHIKIERRIISTIFS